MTALQLNAEMLRELSFIAEDEGLMKKALKAIKKLAEKKRADNANNQALSSQKLTDILREGDEEIAEGNFHPIAIDDLWKQTSTLRPHSISHHRINDIFRISRKIRNTTSDFLEISEVPLQIF